MEIIFIDLHFLYKKVFFAKGSFRVSTLHMLDSIIDEGCLLVIIGHSLLLNKRSCMLKLVLGSGLIGVTKGSPFL